MAGSFVIGNMKVLLGADVSGFTKDMKKGQDSVSKFVGGLKSMAGALGVSLSLGAVAKGIEEIVNTTTDYAKSVEEVSRNLGINTEEASKLLQITDDLEVSQSALEMGFRTALNKGIIPSVDGLIQLADQYRKLPTAAEKAQFAIQTFGSRAGLEMQKVLEKTPAQLRDMSDALEGSALVMSGEAVDAAKEYRLAMDNLEDSMNALTVTVGNEVLPGLTEVASKTLEALDISIRWKNAQNKLRDAVLAGNISVEEQWAIMNSLNTEMGISRTTIEDVTKLEEILASNLMLVTSNMSAGMGDLRAYESGMKDVAGAAEEAAGANSRVAAAIIEATTAAWGKEAIELLNQAYEENLILEEPYENALRNIYSGYLNLEDATIDSTLALRDLKEDLKEGKIELLDAYQAALLYGGSLRELDGLVVDTTVNTTFAQTGYHAPAAMTGGMPSKPATPSYTTSRPEYHQFGSDFVVPGGFRENYPIGYASSGEHVNITPAGKSGNEDIIAAINRLQMPVINERRLARAIRDAMLKVH